MGETVCGTDQGPKVRPHLNANIMKAVSLNRFASFWVYPSLSCLLLYVSGLLGPQVDWSRLCWLVPVGFVSWTILEYVLHRFVFHWQSQNPRIGRILQALHLSHHGDPRNPDKILVRPSFSLLVSAAILAALILISGQVFAAVGILIGIWVGFLYYETVHYRLHVNKGSGALLQYQRRCHFYHHFVDHRHCFGVTSPLWDWIFGTYGSVSSKSE